MQVKFKKSYKFAIKSALFIAIAFALIMSAFLYYYFSFKFFPVLLGTLTCYIFSFVIIQFRVERYIYRRVKSIYDDIKLLESTSLTRESVTTDMATLTQEIDKFARDKKLEIETLKVREQYRKEFLGNVSHELKTPLFTIQGYILTLLDGAMEDSKMRRKYLERANNAVERLSYIVKDLDLITKLEVGDLRLQPEKFDIIALIKEVFGMVEMRANEKKITLTFDRDYQEPIMVWADKERIQQVLVNLIINSLKYGRIKGTTEVSVENLIKNKAIVRVTDNGEGIEKNHLARLFERFYRIDKSGSRREGGSGLGLSIVKHIIEAHDERIYVESEYGVGSEFSFTLEKAK